MKTSLLPRLGVSALLLLGTLVASAQSIILNESFDAFPSRWLNTTDPDVGQGRWGVGANVQPLATFPFSGNFAYINGVGSSGNGTADVLQTQYIDASISNTVGLRFDYVYLPSSNTVCELQAKTTADWVTVATLPAASVPTAYYANLSSSIGGSSTALLRVRYLGAAALAAIAIDNFRVYAPAVTGRFDAALTGLGKQVEPLRTTSNPVHVRLRNLEATALRNQTIAWTVNGRRQPDYAWVGNLGFLQTADSILIGQAALNATEQMRVKAWLVPNATAPDQNASNDTITFRKHRGICGAITVGGPEADFEDMYELYKTIFSYNVLCSPSIQLLKPSTLINTFAIAPIGIRLDSIRIWSRMPNISSFPATASPTLSLTIAGFNTVRIQNAFFQGHNLDVQTADKIELTDSRVYSAKLTASNGMKVARNTIEAGTLTALIASSTLQLDSNLSQFSMPGRLRGAGFTIEGVTRVKPKGTFEYLRLKSCRTLLLPVGETIGLVQTDPNFPTDTVTGLWVTIQPNIPNAKYITFKNSRFANSAYSSFNNLSLRDDASGIRSELRLENCKSELGTTNIDVPAEANFTLTDNKFVNLSIRDIVGSTGYTQKMFARNSLAAAAISGQGYQVFNNTMGNATLNLRNSFFAYNSLSALSFSPGRALANTKIVNNIISGNGAVLSLIDSLTARNFNHNNIYSNNFGTFIFDGTRNITFAGWQQRFNPDPSNTNIFPEYEPGFYNFYNLSLKGLGVVIPSITTDILGAARGASPDMGAVQSVPCSPNVRITNFNMADTLAYGPVNLSFTLWNDGPLRLDSLNVGIRITQSRGPIISLRRRILANQIGRAHV